MQKYASISFRYMLREVVAPLKYRRLFRSKITMNSNATSQFQRNEDKTLVGQINKNISSYKQKMSELKEYQRGNENLRGLWSSAIRKIEGKYGSGVGTYFRFLRTLLSLNVFISVLR